MFRALPNPFLLLESRAPKPPSCSFRHALRWKTERIGLSATSRPVFDRWASTRRPASSSAIRNGAYELPASQPGPGRWSRPASHARRRLDRRDARSPSPGRRARAVTHPTRVSVPNPVERAVRIIPFPRSAGRPVRGHRRSRRLAAADLRRDEDQPAADGNHRQPRPGAAQPARQRTGCL